MVEHGSPETFPLVLTEPQRDALIHAARLRTRIKNLLKGVPQGKQPVSFTQVELGQISEEIYTAMMFASAAYKKQILAVQKKITGLLDALEDKDETRGRRKPSPAGGNLVFQFKITLQRIEPPILRRIQVKDGTLDTLHEHIQTAMGWLNCHLHQFEINGERYGDPQLLCDGLEHVIPFIDSLRTKTSEIVPKSGKRFQFKYEYDFGDSWAHEVLFEGRLPAAKGVRYPICVEGERACPPEDVGGTYGYPEFLKAIADPKHKQHEELTEWYKGFLKWRGGSAESQGPFDPEKFDAAAATKAMQKGLPDWRSQEWC
jgi:hypothetical protein